MKNLRDLKVLIRGAGEMASGVACRLWNAGFDIVMTEIEKPLCVRRGVSFCEAVHHRTMVVEGIEGIFINGIDGILEAWKERKIAVLIDPELSQLADIAPDVIVDATIAKRNLGTRKDMADLVIALGPGFNAGVDAHVVVETNRGHNLGRLIYDGPTEPNTGTPGVIAGESGKRVLRSSAEGVFSSDLDIGAAVTIGQSVGQVGGQAVPAAINGILRGLIRTGVTVPSGLKLGDIDPRGDAGYCYTVSDKSRAIGGSVLEAIMARYNR